MAIHSKAKVKIGQEIIKIDPLYFRPTEVEFLLGDPSKAESILNWKLTYSINDLVSEMIDHDLKLFKPGN